MDQAWRRPGSPPRRSGPDTTVPPFTLGPRRHRACHRVIARLIWRHLARDRLGVDVAEEVGGDRGAGEIGDQEDPEVDGRRHRVRLWVPDVSQVVATSGAAVAGAGAGRPRPAAATGGGGGGAAGAGQVTVPMQGTIVKVLVAVGDTVEIGQAVCVLEAMKMENQINAEKAGTVAEIRVKAGDTVGAGDVVAVIE